MDGVGDYSRRLAAEIAARGHECRLLSLADFHVTTPTVSEFHEAGATLPALRLPGVASWPDRVRRAREYSETFGPDWISWQIVPYGFHPRGMSFGLGGRLGEISRGFKTEIMFHEIWIGEATQAQMKHKLVGQVQRQIIRDLLRQLRPRVVHTHTPLYQHLLGALGHRATILPLFGNIPIAGAVDPGWLDAHWAEGRGRITSETRGGWWIFAMFGSIHPEWDAGDFRQRVTAAAAKAGRKCLLISIGRPGAAGEQKLQRLGERQDEAWQVLTLGQQREEDVSQCLLLADFGVASVPPENVFKSGTMVAMLEHGLQVILTRVASSYAGFSPEQLTAGMRNVVTDFNLEGLGKTQPGSLLPSVATQFLGDLQKA
jgi:hypothetical protein